MAVKKITILYEDKEYTLEFNRNSIRQMERQGFVARSIDDMPMSMIMSLVSGAFLMHHRNLRESEIEKIYASIKNKENFLAKLSEMYAEPVMALMEEPEDDKGNAMWEASW